MLINLDIHQKIEALSFRFHCLNKISYVHCSEQLIVVSCLFNNQAKKLSLNLEYMNVNINKLFLSSTFDATH